jgi:3-methyladenine DNA glycosylase AlkC
MSEKVSLELTINSLQLLASSDDWHKREDAGFSLRDLMEKHFDEVIKLTESWVTHSDERVRRAACLACMQRKAQTDISRLPKILNRLERIMEDDSLYVRKCCGPFVVGYLGYTYPSVTLPWLIEQAKKDDLNVRTNVAKAFSQALGGHHPKEGLSILEILVSDQRRRIRSAVVAALRNIMKRGGISASQIKQRFPVIYIKVVGK